jgi:hypothetical protein
MIKVINSTPPTRETMTISRASLVSSEPPPREEVFFVGEIVGDQVSTSRTTVFDVSTTGLPNTTDVELVIVKEPSAMDSSTQRDAVSGSEKDVATFRTVKRRILWRVEGEGGGRPGY